MFLFLKKLTSIRIPISVKKVNPIIFIISISVAESLNLNSSSSVHIASKIVKTVRLTIAITRYLYDFFSILNLSKIKDKCEASLLLRNVRLQQRLPLRIQFIIQCCLCWFY